MSELCDDHVDAHEVDARAKHRLWLIGGSLRLVGLLLSRLLLNRLLLSRLLLNRLLLSRPLLNGRLGRLRGLGPLGGALHPGQRDRNQAGEQSGPETAGHTLS